MVADNFNPPKSPPLKPDEIMSQLRAMAKEFGLDMFIKYLDTTNRTVTEMQKAMELAGYFYSYGRGKFLDAETFLEVIGSDSEAENCHPWDMRRLSDAMSCVNWLNRQKQAA
jgi:hypothetical protein